MREQKVSGRKENVCLRFYNYHLFPKSNSRVLSLLQMDDHCAIANFKTSWYCILRIYYKQTTFCDMEFRSGLSFVYVLKVVFCLIACWWLFPRLRRFWTMLTIHFLPALFSFFFPFIYQVEISSCTLIPLSMPASVHSGSARWDDCVGVFPYRLQVSSFLDRFPRYVCTAA